MPLLLSVPVLAKNTAETGSNLTSCVGYPEGSCDCVLRGFLDQCRAMLTAHVSNISYHLQLATKLAPLSHQALAR
jgi:hypothetical protein